MRLTKEVMERELDKVCRDDRPKIIWDLHLKGFGVRLSPCSKFYPEGKASYIGQKNAAGRLSRKYQITFGVYPVMDLSTAYNKALLLIGEIRNGVDVSARTAKFNQLLAEQHSNTFDKAYQRYYERHKTIIGPSKSLTPLNLEFSLSLVSGLSHQFPTKTAEL